jgi:hypothetical protein
MFFTTDTTSTPLVTRAVQVHTFGEDAPAADHIFVTAISIDTPIPIPITTTDNDDNDTDRFQNDDASTVVTELERRQRRPFYVALLYPRCPRRSGR